MLAPLLVLALDALPEPAWGPELRAFVEAETEGYEGELGLRVVDVARREAFGVRDEVPMYLASGVKLAFMVAVYRAIEAGALAPGDELVYSEDDLRDGAPRLNKRKVGARVSVSELLEHMMRASDNAASDLLVEKVGLRAVDEGLLAEGIEGFTPLVKLIDVRRGVYRALDPRADDLLPAEVRRTRWTPIWRPQLRRLERFLGVPRGRFDEAAILDAYAAFYAAGVNRAPMRAVARLFEKMLAGTLVSERASQSMLLLLAGARTSQSRLLGRLPKGLRVAHKTGSQYLHFCDLGIVFLPGSGDPLVLTMCTEGGRLGPSEALMAAAARRAFDLALDGR